MANNMNTNASINVGVKGVEQLTQLQNKLGGLTNSFSEIKKSLVGFAVGGFVASLYQSAAAIKDVSDASGIGVQQLLGFQKAVKQFGGSAEGALDGVSKLAQAIDGAANGSKTLQDRFLDLDIGLSDLRSLSEGEILERVVKSLGQGENGAAKMAAAIEIFGKKFKAVNFQDVAEKLDKYTASQKAAAQATIEADKAEEAFGNAMGNFKSQLLIVLQPISELSAALLNMGGIVTGVIKAIISIGAAVLAFTALGKVVQWGGAAFAAFASGVGALKGFFTVAGNAAGNFGAIIGQIGLLSLGGKLRLVGVLFADFATWVLKNIPAIAALGIALSGLWSILGDGIDAIKNYLGFSTDAKKKAEEQAEAEKKKAKSLRDVTDAYAKQRLEIQQASEAFSKQNKNILDQINLNTSLIGTTKQYQDTVKAQEEIFKRAADESDKLRQAKDKLSEAEKKQGLGGEYDRQIAKIQEVANADAEKAARIIENNNRVEASEQVRLFGIQSQINLSKELTTVQDNMAKMGLSALEKKYYDIEAAAKAAAKAGIEAEETRIGRKLSTNEAKAYYDAAIKGAEDLKAVTDEEYKNSRKFSTGWKSAFNDYVENATNAAMQAQTVFQTFTRSMEDSLYNFFKTGKFGFKEMLQTMTDALLRSQIQSLMGKVMSVGSGGSGGGNFFSSLLGFANGGVIPTNGPVIVGERGPEILSGVGGRSVTPNSALGGSTVVNYNISAVDAMSFKSMIARDPSFIHAVAMQGAKSIPGRI